MCKICPLHVVGVTSQSAEPRQPSKADRLTFLICCVTWEQGGLWKLFLARRSPVEWLRLMLCCLFPDGAASVCVQYWLLSTRLLRGGLITLCMEKCLLNTKFWYLTSESHQCKWVSGPACLLCCGWRCYVFCPSAPLFGTQYLEANDIHLWSQDLDWTKPWWSLLMLHQLTFDQRCKVTVIVTVLALFK